MFVPLLDRLLDGDPVARTTAWTCPASSGAAAAAATTASNSAGTLPPTAGVTMLRSAIIVVIAAPSPSGSRPSRRTVVPVRCFGFLPVTTLRHRPVQLRKDADHWCTDGQWPPRAP
ncbi:hypothetical protein ACIOUE_39185 [Streptomyces xanthochromogenes]|uniref:hypothetical protein n=1 Tax=Streptomyces xanthochromogenes TaxID=67384 RepID=UPI003816A48F